MRLFWKIFSVIAASFIGIYLMIGYGMTTWLSSHTEDLFYRENNILADFIAKEVEIGCFESNWPFETLYKLSNRENQKPATQA